MYEVGKLRPDGKYNVWSKIKLDNLYSVWVITEVFDDLEEASNYCVLENRRLKKIR